MAASIFVDPDWIASIRVAHPVGIAGAREALQTNHLAVALTASRCLLDDTSSR